MKHTTPSRGLVLALLIGASLTLAACNRQQDKPTTSGSSGNAPSQETGSGTSQGATTSGSGGEFPPGAAGSAGTASQAPSGSPVPGPTQGSSNRTPGARY